MSTTEKFSKLLEEKIEKHGVIDDEGFYMAVTEIAEEQPELASEVMDKFEKNAQRIMKHDFSTFIKDEYNSLKKHGAFGGNSSEGLSIEMLARCMGDFIASFPEYSQRGLNVIKELSSSKSHNEVSLAGSCEALGKILSVCPAEMDKDALNVWKTVVKRKGKRNLKNEFQYFGLLKGAVQAVHKAKPYLDSNLIDILEIAENKHDASDMHIDSIKEKILANKKRKKTADNHLAKIRKKMAQSIDNTLGTNLEQRKVSKPLKKIEKAVSDKLFGEIKE